jgi:hypothetical protein
MSILTITNAEKEAPSILNYSMMCIGNGEVETCSLETTLPINDYINYNGDMFLTFDLVSVNGLDLRLSKNGEQYENVNNTTYSFNSNDTLTLKTEKDTTDAGNNAVDVSYNMNIYRDAIDQNDNNGNPVLLKTILININSL